MTRSQATARSTHHPYCGPYHHQHFPESPRPARSAPEPALLDLIQMCWDGNLVAVQRLLDDGADANEVERDEVEGIGEDWPPHSGLG